MPVRSLPILLVLLAPGDVLGDWPGWRGPQRTGVSAETGLLKRWPPEGPRLLWKATGAGGGYATPSVAAGKLFVLGSQGEDEFLLAYDVKEGKNLWSTRLGRIGVNDGPNYPGPRSTPTVDGVLLYALGSDGDLVCAETTSGKERWRRHLIKDFGGERGTWAYAESVLIDGDLLVCTPGGPTHCLVGLEKATGKVVWKTEMPEKNVVGYSSAIVVQVGPVKQYVQFLGPGVVGVSARDGKLLWRYSGNVGGQSCMTPIFHDGFVFTSASGVAGAGGDALLRLIPTPDGGCQARQVYLLRNMLNHHGGVVRVGEYLYGTGGASLVCLDFRSGKLMWKQRGVGSGSLLAADGHLYVRGASGEVALVEATPDAYREKGRFRQPARSRFPAFCHPVLADGKLFLRDEDVLLCYDVREP